MRNDPRLWADITHTFPTEYNVLKPAHEALSIKRELKGGYLHLNELNKMCL